MGLEPENGEILPWTVTYQQSNATGQSANITMVDIDTLVNGSPHGPITRQTAQIYDSQAGTYGPEFGYYIGHNFALDMEPWYAWIRSVGAIGSTFDPTNFDARLPFGVVFMRTSTNEYDTNLWPITKWNDTDPGTFKYSLGGNSSFTKYGYSNFYFSFIGGNYNGKPYRGYFCWGHDVNFRYITYSFKIFELDTITNYLGTFETAEKPADDEQKGFPSLPIGEAGNAVQKRIDEITLPDMPTLGVSTTGALNVYKVGLHDLTDFIGEIFHTGIRRDYTGSDVGEMLANGLINITNAITDTVNGDVTQFVVDMHIIPVVPSIASQATNINIGGFTTESLGRPVTSDYVDFSCGSISISKDSGVTMYDDFLDLKSRYKLYLPFIGFVDIPPSYAYNKILTVKYRFNVIDGSCIAFVSSSLLNLESTSIIGVYSGSCCVHMPITGQNYSNVISGMLNTVGGALKGNPLQMGKGMLEMTKPDVTMSNSYNASTAFMGVRRPYLLIEKPTKNIPVSYYDRIGGRTNVTYKLDNLVGSGYTKCEAVKLEGLDIDTDEIVEIRQLLESGVYL